MKRKLLVRRRELFVALRRLRYRVDFCLERAIVVFDRRNISTKSTPKLVVVFRLAQIIFDLLQPELDREDLVVACP